MGTPAGAWRVIASTPALHKPQTLQHYKFPHGCPSLTLIIIVIRYELGFDIPVSAYKH